MSDTPAAETPPPAPARRWGRRLLRGVGGAAIALLVLLGALTALLHLPPAQRAVTRLAARQAEAALDASIEVGSLRWNLLAGHVEARDVAVRGRAERAGTELTLERLTADVSFRALLSGRLVVENVTAEALGARLALDEKGGLLLPIRLPETKDEEDTGRPDVVVRDVRVSRGFLELVDRGPAGRRIDVKDITLSGDLRLRELASSGALTLGTVDVAAAGRVPLRGTSLEVRWKTLGTTARLDGSLTSKEAGVAVRVEGNAEDLATTPRYSGVVTASGTLGPLAARLLPDLGLQGTIEARAEVTGHGAELPAVRGTARATGLSILGRTVDVADLSFDSAAGRVNAAALDLTAGDGRLHGELSGAVLPAVKDLVFRLRADRVDVAALLPRQAGRTRLAAVLGGEVSGTLASPSLAGLTASADLTVSGSVRRGPGVLAPDIRLKGRIAKGIVTADEARLRVDGTRADASGTYDAARELFSGRLDVESTDIGPTLALAGLTGHGALSAHLRGSGSLSRPALDGNLRGRSLAIEGVALDCVELDATTDGRAFTVRNGLIAAYDASAVVEADGTLPGPGARPAELELRVRGVTFRGRGLPDATGHARVGSTVELRLETSDGRLRGHATVPAKGGFEAGATFDKLGLGGLAAALPSHLADFEGEVSGRIEASRGTTGPLSASLQLEDLSVAVGGRRITSRGAQATLVGERFEVTGVELAADDGSHLWLSGSGSADGSALDLHLRTEVPELGAFASLVPDAAPLAGSVSADVRISGSRAKPRATGTVRVRDLVAGESGLERLDATLAPGERGTLGARLSLAGLRYGSYRLREVELAATVDGDDVVLNGETFGRHLLVEAKGSLAGGRPYTATVTLDELDIASLVGLVGGPASLGGLVSGSISARGTLDDPKGASVETELVRLELVDKESRLAATAPVRIAVERGRVEVRSLKLEGTGLSLDAEGSLPFEGRPDGRLTVDATFDLAALLPFVQQLDRAKGRLAARLEVTGSVSSPSASGTVTIADGLLDGPAFPAPVERLHGKLALRPSEVALESLEARLGGGTLSLTGTLGLDGVRPRRLEAFLQAKDLDLEAAKDLQVRAGGSLSAKGTWPSFAVSGEVRLDDATYVPELEIMTLLKKLTSRTVRRPSPEKRDAADRLEIALDVAVVAKDAIHLEGGLGDVEAGGNLRIKGTVATPVVLGSVASNRGTLYVLGSTFDLTRARLDFSDPLVIDPDVDVVATTTKSEEEITVRINGKASKAQLLLSSSKGRSQAEIVSVLLGGSGEPGSSTALAASAARMAVRGASSPLLGALGAQADLELVPLPTTPEGENFLFSVGKDLGSGVSATYFKGLSGETTDALEVRWRISSRARGRLRQNQDGSLSGGFRIRREFH